MKLDRLVLHGFKSFADRTELRFHDGITAIVGPNGCGKSNISDAIKWALGEQRASAIRGSRMEEAIFQGTTQRRPVNRAEVSLVFENHEGRIAVPQSEIEIKRTVFREGGSEYELNRQACRLRDIYDICRDTGLGVNAYAVIEQGMVDAILSDRTDERRHLFEEAAGIGRYKDRRKAAQRRLEQAEQDLARLGDLIAEVESKVRSLARQSRRAQRWQELRNERLVLEITLATLELAEIRATLDATGARLRQLGEEDPSARAALSTAETELERRRVDAAVAGRDRGAVAQRLEQAGRRIAERERELAVADERRAHSVARIQQIDVERRELQERLEQLRRELVGLDEQREQQAVMVEAVRERAEQVQAQQQAMRQELAEARRAEEQARAGEQELMRRLAGLEAAAAAAEARAAEVEQRLERMAADQREIAGQLEELGEQGDLFTSAVGDLVRRRDAVAAEHEAAVALLEETRRMEAAARQSLSRAEEQASALSARVAALDALERDFHGFAPAVAGALGERERIEGLVGPLSELLALDAERAAALEGALGSLLQILVVQDGDAAGRVRAWLDEHRPGGTVALLTRDGVARVEALVEALEFAGEPPTETVLVGRRERLEALREEAARAARARDDAAAERDRLAEAAAMADSAAREADARRHALDLELRRMESDETTRRGRHIQAERARQELERRRQEWQTVAERSRREAVQAREQREAFKEELERLRDDGADAARLVAAREARWESARDEEAEVRVEQARAESALNEIDRRVASARGAIQHSSLRLEAINNEEREHRASLQMVDSLRTDAGDDLEQLFRTRDEVSEELRALDERLADANEAAEALESRVRALRRDLEARGEERHRLELRQAEAKAAEERVRDRLEAEWGKPFAQLQEEASGLENVPPRPPLGEAAVPVPGREDDSTTGQEAHVPAARGTAPAARGGGTLDVPALRVRLKEVAADIERLGPINMLAIEEHAEESERLRFLTEQKTDLETARDDLNSAIRQINRTARQLFMETFEQVRQNFHETFQSLFEGGECDVWLADPDDPLESDVEVSASPRGKRTQRIHLLSGGERALTALALLFAIYLVKPSPFCVMDEVDAPLDESNVGRFVAMLERFKASTQFVVITHNPRTMEAADWIYGVTMAEPGISSIVGVELDEALRTTAQAMV